MLTQEFRHNRARYPREELVKYGGQWVAFSPDGCRIVASAGTLEDLEGVLAATGADVQRLVLEGIPGPTDDLWLGGEEVS